MTQADAEAVAKAIQEIFKADEELAASLKRRQEICVLSAALTVQNWCGTHACKDCLFNRGDAVCRVREFPMRWDLEGLDDAGQDATDTGAD